MLHFLGVSLSGRVAAVPPSAPPQAPRQSRVVNTWPASPQTPFPDQHVGRQWARCRRRGGRAARGAWGPGLPRSVGAGVTGRPVSGHPAVSHPPTRVSHPSALTCAPCSRPFRTPASERRVEPEAVRPSSSGPRRLRTAESALTGEVCRAPATFPLTRGPCSLRGDTPPFTLPASEAGGPSKRRAPPPAHA